MTDSDTFEKMQSCFNIQKSIKVTHYTKNNREVI